MYISALAKFGNLVANYCGTTIACGQILWQAGRLLFGVANELAQQLLELLGLARPDGRGDGIMVVVDQRPQACDQFEPPIADVDEHAPAVGRVGAPVYQATAY